jgi:vacuolar-type H+-ATPase subunit I/STV1
LGPETSNKDIAEGINALRGDFKKMMVEFQNFRLSLESSAKIMESLCVRMENIETRLDELDKLEQRVVANETTLTDVRTRMEAQTVMIQREEALEKEVSVLKERVQRLTDEKNENDQYERANNLEILGVPQKDGEQVRDIVLNIASKLEVSITASDLIFCRRVSPWTKQTGSRTPPKIIVKFISRDKVDNIISAIRRKKKLTTRDMEMDNMDSRIFLNYHLTIENKRLLKRTKEVAGIKEYQYCWVKRCLIYVRKNDKSPAMLIRREADLVRMI